MARGLRQQGSVF